MEKTGELRRVEAYAPWMRSWSGWAWNAMSTLPRRLLSARAPEEQVFVVVPVLQVGGGGQGGDRGWQCYRLPCVIDSDGRATTC